MPPFPPQDTIWLAVQRGDLDLVRQYFERDGVPYIEDDYDTQSLLSTACAAGHVEIVRFLWNSGARATHYGGRAPEAFAAMENGHLEVFRLLCDFGLDPYSTRYSKHGEYLIDRAIEEKRVDFVRLLMSLGASVVLYKYEHEITEEEQLSDVDPPEIALAARAGALKDVEFLLEVGVNLDGQEPDYYLDLARSNAHKFQRSVYVGEGILDRSSRITPLSDSHDVFWGCSFTALIGVASIWIIYRLSIRFGWEDVACIGAFLSFVIAEKFRHPKN